jgi:SulP family sulfate permease
LESLEAIASRLKDAGIALHFSEIKGPVMDKLGTTAFFQHVHGRVFLTNYQAIEALTPEVIPLACSPTSPPPTSPTGSSQ